MNNNDQKISEPLEVLLLKIKHVDPARKLSINDLPTKATSGSCGYDLMFYSPKCVTLAPGERRLLSTGLIIEIPAGYSGEIVPRSGLALKYGITVLNTPGTIDSDYRGEVKVLLVNLGQFQYTIEPGERIAQIIFRRSFEAIVEINTELTETERGDGGFGRSGK